MPTTGNDFDQARRLITCGNYSEALPLLLTALNSSPNDPAIHAQLGIVYQKQYDYQKAEEHYLQAQRLNPDFPEVFNNLSVLYKETGRFDEGLVYIEKALQSCPGQPDYLNNRGTLLLKLNEFDQAQRCFEQAVESNPQYVAAYLNLSNTYLARHDLDRAMRYIRKALALNPTGIEENWNLALLHLFRGDLGQGFQQYEWRWEKDEFKKINRSYTQPRWDGRPYPGKTIFIWPEQGFGDTLQFIRYVQLLKNKFRTVVVEVQGPLTTLIETIPGIDRVISPGTQYTDFDYHLPLLSLPQYFTRDESTVPGKPPYVFPVSSEDSTLLDGRGRKKIGIAWAGRPTHENDHNRSIPFALLEDLIDRNDVAWFSFQKGPATRDIRNHTRIVDLSPQIKDFHDTARLLVQMDLVITIDSAVCHLAGALGVRTWVLLPYQSDWRWMYGRNDTPWYSTMKLFRQDADCSWKPVMSKVHAQINKIIAL